MTNSSDLLVDGDSGKLFRKNSSEIDNTYLEDGEVFGQIMFAYILFHNEVAWPFRLNVSNFFIAYKMQKWTPPMVNGAIGKQWNYCQTMHLLLKLRLYNKYVIGHDRLQIIKRFSKGLNQLDVFSFFRENVSDDTLYAWFTQSGQMNGDLLNSLLDSFFGDVQLEDIARA